jgi:hypothetical protein
VRRLIGRSLQARRLRHERRRLDRLYGPTCFRTIPAPMGVGGQTDRLGRIVADYCQRGEAAAKVHDAARVKLDAAEYAFASLLKELSSVMGEAPSAWTPARTVVADASGVNHRIQAVAA